MEVAGSCLQWQWQNSPSIPRLRLLTYPSLSRRQSLDCLRRTPRTPLARSLSAGFTNDGESDDEFVKRIQHLVLDEEEEEITTTSSASFSAEPPWPAVRPERRDDGLVVPASVKRWADSVGGALPLSLRIIKKKKKRALEGDASTAGESAVKKAFSSTVFIVRELQSYALRMREVLFFENLQGVLARVQEDMNASFVWLFQHIFSSTPTLMVYVMLLLANFTVHSVGAGPALAAAPVPIQHQASALLAVERRDCDRNQDQSTRFESSAVLKTSGIGKTASVSGSGGGGGTKTTKPVAGGTDDGPNYNGGGVGVALPEEEAAVWNRMVEEAARIGAGGERRGADGPRRAAEPRGACEGGRGGAGGGLRGALEDGDDVPPGTGCRPAEHSAALEFRSVPLPCSSRPRQSGVLLQEGSGDEARRCRVVEQIRELPMAGP
ncbi:uncharacterized protein M6B38_125190 [Iris pallida]|uniref:Uncharacterized protein n=1 Tax=Iris pallida TaxID=29817 RepID=A0AAX6GVK0_IRIPA|nr:uncharacterized protein M6B38_125190 [Iris pallida]